MRAFLLARATVTCRTGCRSSSPRTHLPAALSQCAARYTIEVAPSTSKVRICPFPALVILPRRVLPPLECCRGTSPSQAAKCRALLKLPMPSPTVAVIREAVIGPTPGIVASLRATSCCRACATICLSRPAMRSVVALQCSRSSEGSACLLRKARVLLHQCHEFLELAHALRHDQSELGRQAAHGVGQHGFLLDQERSHGVQGECSLLLQALCRHELRLRAGGSSADRRCIGRVVLLASLDEWLDRFGRNQLHLVAETAYHTRPVMGRTARLHDHGAARLLLEEADQLVALQLALQEHFALSIEAVQMENRLGGVHADHANAHHGRLPCCGSRQPHLGTPMPLGVVHSIYPGCGSRDADVLQSSEVEHTVQGIGSNGYLGRLSP